MASTQAMQKAAAAAERRRKERLATISPAGKPQPTFKSTFNISKQMAVGLFDLNHEIEKTFDVILSDPQPHPTAMNDQDWTDLQPEFKDGAGFFFTIIEQVINPATGLYGVRSDARASSEEALAVYKKYKASQFEVCGKRYLILSTWCSIDMVWDKFQELKHTFLNTAIVYSQPSYRNILGENC